jgi:hypothetical protein
MTQQPAEPKKKNSHLQNVFSTFPFIGAFSLTQLANYPYNFMLFLIPFLVCEGILIVFYINKINKKKQSAITVDQKNPGANPTPKPKGVAVEKYDISNDTLKFSALKGLYKKKWVIIKEIPVYDISDVKSLGNELSVTWKGATDWFVIYKKGASFIGLPEQIQSLLDEHQKTLEAQAKAAQRKTDLTSLLNFSVGIVDSSFDMLMGLQIKPVNWEKLEIYTDSLQEKTVFTGQTLAPLKLDFSKVAEAAKSQVPENASKEIFDVLKAVYVYFEELNLEDDIEQAHPNFKDAKVAILACFTLNDIWLGKIVGEKDSQKETEVLKDALQKLANETAFKINFEVLKAGFDKTSPDAELESAIEDTREAFKTQLRNLGQPMEQTAATVPPTEPAAAPPEQSLPVPQEIAPPPEPIIPAPEPTPIPEPTEPPQPPTIEPPIEPEPVIQPAAEPEPPTFEQTIKPQPAIELPTESAPVEQKVPEPPKPQEPVQSAELEVTSVGPAVESAVVESQSIEESSTVAPEVHVQEPVEDILPQNEDVKPSVEEPKKKGLGQRLRKAVMGY